MSVWPKQTIREVAEGIFAVVHGRGEMGVSNATFVIEPDRACVVDTMTFPEMALQMAHAIARHNVQVETVLNTHHHIDHVGGNTVFGEARILSHPLSIEAGHNLGFPRSIYERLMPYFKDHFEKLELRPAAPLLEPLHLPQEGELLPFLSAHTAADMAVWFPQSRILLSGDLCFKGVVPLALNGLISGWIDALNTLIALEPSVVVPGHGEIGTMTDLIILRNYFLSLQRLGRDTLEGGLSLKDALASFDPGPVSEWIEPERHAINLERVIKEIKGEISRTNLTAPLFVDHR